MSLPVLFFLGLRASRSRIGADGEKLYIADHTGRYCRSSPEEAVYTSRLVAFQSWAAPLSLGNGRALYSESDVQRYVKPLFERAQRVGEINLMIYQTVHMHPLTLAVVATIVIGTAMIISLGVWRVFF